MATEKWVAGAVPSYVDLTTTASLNTFTSGNALLGTVVVANGTNLDMFADVSILLGSITPVSPNFVGVYLYPLNKDGSTYGDGRFGSSAAGPPPANYCVGTIGIVASVGAQEGTCRGIVLPPTDFKFVLYNQAGVNWAASGNTAQYKTYNRSVA